MSAGQPYRTSGRPFPGSAPMAWRATMLGTAQAFVIGWSLLRLAVCMRDGLDVDGCLALMIILATLPFRRLARWGARLFRPTPYDAETSGSRGA